MKRNVSKTDLIIRLILGTILLIVSFLDLLNDELISLILLCAGGVLIITTLLRFCPLYFFLGLNTNKPKKMKMY